MSKIINWLLPAFVLVGAILDGCFDLIKETIVLFGIHPGYVVVTRIIIVAAGVIALKIQPPNLKRTRIKKPIK